MLTPHFEHPPVSRRGFLAGAAIALASPTLLSCRRVDPDAADVVGKDPPSVRPPLPDAEPLMRVRLARARGKSATLSVGAPKQWLRVGAGGTKTQAPLEVHLTGKGWRVTDRRGRTTSIRGTEPLEILTLDDADPAIGYGEQVYPGTMRLVARSDLGATAFDLVSLVPMEQYLPGVLSAELFNHWKPDTHAALAVAARSFAAAEHAYFRGRRMYDVSNTANSQVYRGRVKHATSIEAVRVTRGRVLAYEDRLVPGYYSACCGGTAARALDMISRNPINDTPPLNGRDGEDVCTKFKVARWTVDRPTDELVRRIAGWGRRRRHAELGTLAGLSGIEVIERNEHGRPTRFAVVATDGPRIELSAENLRRAANANVDGLGAPKRALWSSHLEVAVKRGKTTFKGRGSGHGVGLCQYGAEELARRGQSWRKIVDWYYPGADVQRAY